MENEVFLKAKEDIWDFSKPRRQKVFIEGKSYLVIQNYLPDYARVIDENGKEHLITKDWLNTKFEIITKKFSDGGSIEEKAKEFLDNIPKEEWEKLTHAFKGAMAEAIKTETEKLNSLNTDLIKNRVEK